MRIGVGRRAPAGTVQTPGASCSRKIAGAQIPLLPNRRERRMPVPRHLIDPESRVVLDEALAASPSGLFNHPDIAIRRAKYSSEIAELRASLPPDDRYTWHDITVPGLDDDPPIVVRIFRPRGHNSGALPAVLYVHGGGMVFESVDDEHLEAAGICTSTGSVVASMEYRLAPENPYPAAIRDCLATQRWLFTAADSIGIDASRTAIYGASAGGGLALGTTLLARDLGVRPVGFVMAIYPMIDDRNDTHSSRYVTDVGVWDRSTNIEAWQWYLGGAQPDIYSSPARATDLSGLPPTFIDIGTLDLFLDESVTFARRLIECEVPTELHVYPGAYHGSEYIAPGAELRQRIIDTRVAALRRALD